MAVLAVLAGLVAANTSGLSNKARASTKTSDIAEVQRAVDGFRGQHPFNYYPVRPQADMLTANTRIDFAASFITPEGLTLKFVPDFLQHPAKHASDAPDSWQITPDGKVTNTLSNGDY